MRATTDHESPGVDSWGYPPILLRVNETFDQLVGLNPELRIEQTSRGEVQIMSPTGGESGERNARIVAQLVVWSESQGGRVFDSSTLFQLPSGAKRSPDASWVSDARWRQLSPAERKGFPPICPDLVIELRSESDRLIDLQGKMEEYLASGSQLGWLIDPLRKQVHIYQPGREPEVLTEPHSLSAGSVLPALVLDLRRIWVDR